jgi:hypothetical protein
MAGMEMITIEASIVAIVMLSVVLESATHLYRSPADPRPSDLARSVSAGAARCCFHRRSSHG